MKFLRPRSSRSPGRNYTQGVWVFSLRMLRNLRVPLGITLRCLRHNIHSYAYTFRFPRLCSLQSLSEEVGQVSLCVGTWACHKHMLSTIHTPWLIMEPKGQDHAQGVLRHSQVSPWHPETSSRGSLGAVVPHFMPSVVIFAP